jgi:hypothetical protein
MGIPWPINFFCDLTPPLPYADRSGLTGESYRLLHDSTTITFLYLMWVMGCAEACAWIVSSLTQVVSIPGIHLIA